MAIDRPSLARCAKTGLAVPECSCRHCLEAMLRRFSPSLLDGEIRITRAASPPPRDGRPRAA